MANPLETHWNRARPIPATFAGSWLTKTYPALTSRQILPTGDAAGRLRERRRTRRSSSPEADIREVRDGWRPDHDPHQKAPPEIHISGSLD